MFQIFIQTPINFSIMPKEFDPILDDPGSECDRFVLGEIANMQAFNMYKQALASFWVAESCDLSTDYLQFEKLKKQEKDFLLMVLAFFAGSDGIVLENCVTRFYDEVKQAEVRLFYGFQIAMENIHSEVYTELIQALEKDKSKRELLFRAIDNYDAVKAKAKWSEKWLNSKAGFGERLVAFACVEGILFSSSFCAIFYFKKRGYQMPGLFQSNEYISRDEGLHCKFAVLIYGQLKAHNKISPARIREIVKSAVEVEKQFIDEALKESVLGMNKESMLQYVKFVADGLLLMLGCERIYNLENPYHWMEGISIDNKTNFFERRVTEYALADVKTSSEKVKTEPQPKFKLDEDF